MSFMLLGILNSQAAGGGAGAFDLLETTTLTSSASSVTFSGLGAYSDYKHLQIRMVTRSSQTGTDNSSIGLAYGATGSGSYSFHYLRANGSGVASSGFSPDTNSNLGDTTADQAPTGAFGAAVFDVLDFSSSVKNTTHRGLIGFYGDNAKNIKLSSGAYFNTAAVTSISVFNPSYSFVAGSRFSLYGRA
tara:strand:- start:2158 stop:2724 length:567 start_codon:yes stop_codon:yes gene_type:complete